MKSFLIFIVCCVLFAAYSGNMFWVGIGIGILIKVCYDMRRDSVKNQTKSQAPLRIDLRKTRR